MTFPLLRECTAKCRSQQHATDLVAAVTSRTATTDQLKLYSVQRCANFGHVRDRYCKDFCLHYCLLITCFIINVYFRITCSMNWSILSKTSIFQLKHLVSITPCCHCCCYFWEWCCCYWLSCNFGYCTCSGTSVVRESGGDDDGDGVLMVVMLATLVNIVHLCI